MSASDSADFEGDDFPRGGRVCVNRARRLQVLIVEFVNVNGFAARPRVCVKPPTSGRGRPLACIRA